MVIELKAFSSIDLNDKFFDSLKDDYDGFEDWYKRKADKKSRSLFNMIRKIICKVSFI